MTQFVNTVYCCFRRFFGTSATQAETTTQLWRKGQIDCYSQLVWVTTVAVFHSPLALFSLIAHGLKSLQKSVCPLLAPGFDGVH